MAHEQDGIKWWKHCPVCLWAARTRGNPNDNERTTCPNCNNPDLHVEIDDRVFKGQRYDARVRNQRGQDIADAVRQNAGRPPAPQDTTDASNRGHDYGQGPKPFPDPPTGQP